MNDPRAAARPVRSRAEQQRRRAMAEKKKRRRRARLYARIRTVILILLALAVGYSLGLRAGRAEVRPTPAETLPPAPAETQLRVTEPPYTGPIDTQPPQIMGVNHLAVFVGSTVSYRSGILVTDDLDPAPVLSVDSSRVNLTTPGTYPVVYTATDRAGNSASLETTITITQAPDSYVDEETIKAKADAILDRILTDDMTPREQVEAVYDYIENHHYYVANFDKSDYMQAAYLMMTENRGDCYGYYALSRLFFERMNLPNLTVTRTPNDVRTTNHWWNMVSLDGGGSWYHFDSTPHLTYPTRTCLVTVAFLLDFTLLMPNYSYFAHDAVPATPDA